MQGRDGNASDAEHAIRLADVLSDSCRATREALGSFESKAEAQDARIEGLAGRIQTLEAQLAERDAPLLVRIVRGFWRFLFGRGRCGSCFSWDRYACLPFQKCCCCCEACMAFGRPHLTGMSRQTILYRGVPGYHAWLSGILGLPSSQEGSWPSCCMLLLIQCIQVSAACSLYCTVL